MVHRLSTYLSLASFTYTSKCFSYHHWDKKEVPADTKCNQITSTTTRRYKKQTANGNKGEQRNYVSKVCLHLLAPLKFRPGRFSSAKTPTKIERSATLKIPANTGFCMRRPGKEKPGKKRDLFFFGFLMSAKSTRVVKKKAKQASTHTHTSPETSKQGVVDDKTLKYDDEIDINEHLDQSIRC